MNFVSYMKDLCFFWCLCFLYLDAYIEVIILIFLWFSYCCKNVSRGNDHFGVTLQRIKHVNFSVKR